MDRLAINLVIAALALLSGYLLAIHTLSKRISFDRFLVLERLYMASRDFLEAQRFDEIEIHGERIHKLVKALGGKKE